MNQQQHLDFEQIIYKLVLHGGNARGEAYEALDAAESFDFESANLHLEKAEEEFYNGHKWQTMLVQSATEQPPSFLIVHAQDQLMTALAEMNLVKRLIKSYRMYDELKHRIETLERSKGEINVPNNGYSS